MHAVMSMVKNISVYSADVILSLILSLQCIGFQLVSSVWLKNCYQCLLYLLLLFDNIAARNIINFIKESHFYSTV